MTELDDFTQGVLEGLKMAIITLKKVPATNRISLDMAIDSISTDVGKIEEMILKDNNLDKK